MPERIDGAIILALTFILLFFVPPLIALVGRPNRKACSMCRSGKPI
jgi:uncharacterized membrane protein YdfJ with MMPL/SSD domain